MRKISLGISGIAAVVSLATLSIPATAAIPPRPGVVNYVEGQAAINGRTITSRDVGTAVLDENQILSTVQGKVEILLTPGVFLRLNNNGEVRMISPRLTDTSVELRRGEALVEAAGLLKENHVTVLEHGATTTLIKDGLYSFNADLGRVSVYDGEAMVREEDHTVALKKGKDVNLGGPLKAVKFDRHQMDDLYAWSSLRSQYESQANMGSAHSYAVNPGYWYGPGWYWDPYFSFYSFIPGSGFLYSPFGWGFYSPWAAPVVIYRGGGRVVTAPARGGFRGGLQPSPAVRGFSGGGFHGNAGFQGGGFHGGGGRR
jgi:hypothetical protein